METWLTKLDPNNMTLAGVFFVLTLFALWFLTSQIWPFYRDKYIPAKLEAERIKSDREFELQKENNAILIGIRETLSKVSAQLDALNDAFNTLKGNKT